MQGKAGVTAWLLVANGFRCIDVEDMFRSYTKISQDEAKEMMEKEDEHPAYMMSFVLKNTLGIWYTFAKEKSRNAKRYSFTVLSEIAKELTEASACCWAEVFYQFYSMREAPEEQSP